MGLSAGILLQYAPLTGPDESVDTVIRNAVQTALNTGTAKSGDTVIVLVGMMTEFKGVNTTNTLKVHVAAEILASGRSVVPGRAAGPVHHATDGDLTGLPDGAVLVLSAEFDTEFVGDPAKLAGFISARDGVTCYLAIVARELNLPMVFATTLPNDLAGDMVTIDADRSVIYENDISR